jgi:hypothetical protein
MGVRCYPAQRVQFERGRIAVSSLSKPWERLRRLGLTYLALELSAGILALAVTVAVGPWVAVLFSRPEYPWVATAAVLSVSVPAAAILGVSGLKLSRDLVDQARLR